MNRSSAQLTQTTLSPAVPGSSRVHRTTAMIRPAVMALVLAGAAAVPSATNAGAATTLGGTRLALQNATLNQVAPTSITNVRVGRHTTFDRLVIDLSGRGVRYSVRYASTIQTQGEGAPVPLRGGARLEIVVQAPDYDINTWAPTYHFANRKELANVTGFHAFRQVAYGGSFEGYTTIGLGIRARLPVHTSVLNAPGAGSRVVIDVAHH